MSALVDLVALTLLPIWRWRHVAEQLRSGQDASEILRCHCEERARLRGARGSLSGPALLRSRAEVALEKGSRLALGLVAWSDPAYPAALAAIIDPPPVLWVRGGLGLFDTPAVAVVGSRGGSPYALAVAERLSADLAAHGLAVISGLARGVDSAAHRGALSVNGHTIAVLGSGADVVYPAEHADLATEIARTGAIVSEFVPGTRPHPRFFPQRNRIISGLSRAVVVVEAGEKSGSLITARCALEQGRDVLAVPGNILNGRNRGGHALLRDGARIVESADDVLEEIGAAVGAVHEGLSPEAERRPVDGADLVLTSLMPGEPCDLDALSERSGLTPARLLPRLFDLELRGLIRRTGAGRFVRFDRSC